MVHFSIKLRIHKLGIFPLNFETPNGCVNTVAGKAVKQQVNLTLRRQTISKLINKRNNLIRLRSELVDALVASAAVVKKSPTTHKQPTANGGGIAKTVD